MNIEFKAGIFVFCSTKNPGAHQMHPEPVFHSSSVFRNERQVAFLHAANAESGRVRHGNILLREHRAAQHGILGAEHRAVKVDFRDDSARARQMHGGVHGNLRFQHAADHARHAVHLGRGRDLQRRIQAAALHQLDVDQVGRAHLHDFERVRGRKYAFVGQHRHAAALGDVFKTLEIVRGHGLLHEFNIQTAILHGVQDAHGLLGLPRLIRVDAPESWPRPPPRAPPQACARPAPGSRPP